MTRRGFTLIEMVFVIATVTLVAAIALPRFAGASDRQRLLAAGERVAADIAMLREKARAISGSVTVRFARGGYSWDASVGSESGRLVLEDPPYGVTFRFVDAGGGNTVVFDGYGTSDTTLSLILGTGDYRIDYSMPKIVGNGALAPVRVAGYRED